MILLPDDICLFIYLFIYVCLSIVYLSTPVTHPCLTRVPPLAPDRISTLPSSLPLATALDIPHKIYKVTLLSHIPKQMTQKKNIYLSPFVFHFILVHFPMIATFPCFVSPFSTSLFYLLVLFSFIDFYFINIVKRIFFFPFRLTYLFYTFFLLFLLISFILAL